jgi:hypothetical protein
MTQKEILYNLLTDIKSPVWFIDNVQVEKTVDYLLANGVIVPPAKVGDIVWAFYISHPTDYKYTKQGRRKFLEYLAPTTNAVDRNLSVIIIKSKKATTSDISRIGKTVFLTREEAEKVMAERQAKNDK